MQFAALGVLCLFPFLIVVSAGIGHDFRRTVVIRMGLDQHAAKDVNALISTGLHAVTGLSIFGGLCDPPRCDPSSPVNRSPM